MVKKTNYNRAKIIKYSEYQKNSLFLQSSIWTASFFAVTRSEPKSNLEISNTNQHESNRQVH